MAKKNDLVFQSTFETYTAKPADQIGQGGAARVFKARDGEGIEWAVKLLNPNLSDFSNKRKRFRNELTFCQRVRDKGIVRVHDYGRYSDDRGESFFYVMPLYSGSLSKLMKDGIDVGDVLRYFHMMLDAVEALHLLDVCHRDLKPDNFLYDSENDRLLVADLGCAKFQEDDLLTAVKTKAADRVANYRYAAPEQRRKGGAVDRRADIWALGLMLNEMFTGEVPDGSEFTKIASVTEDHGYLDDLVDKMRRNKPDDRPASVGEIKQQLVVPGKGFTEEQKLSNLQDSVVVVPQSAQSSHMVASDRQLGLDGRSEEANVPLDPRQMELLQEGRMQLEALIDAEIATAPLSTSPDHAYLFLFARPVVHDEEMLNRALNGDENFGTKLYNLVNTAATRDGLYPGDGEPAFRPTHRWLIHPDGYLGELGEPSIPGPRYCINLQVDFDGTCHLFCGRAAERLSHQYWFFEGLVKGHTARFVSLMAEICEGAGYAGMVDVGLAITGLRGAYVYSQELRFPMHPRTPPYQDEDYRRSGRYSAYQLKDEPKAVTRKLLERLFNVMTQIPGALL